MRAIPVELDAVVIGVAQVESFADAVVRSAFERDAGALETSKGVSEIGACGIENRRVIETGRTRRRWRTTEAFPSIQPDVMMIASSGNEGGGGSVADSEFEAKDAAVEFESAFEIRDLEVNVTDAGLRRNGTEALAGLVARWHDAMVDQREA